ncbi:hypothetical protein [Chroococcidiopsis thermalis]|uniref:Uncharacterized protein n=1 Tax=Chroococcidiopsis thermalis (strain PCC 7203) TaxID=251229 RepID=K9U511_CHRTP|nr:hypothetical protein [Chroococcidiopsis thermalis]AFY89304.1 hypothetical protein Chro_3888 [Chroococcidiopsis thermalis PCC 7203]
MSEYQYYEFQTLDRSLTKQEQAAIAQLSSRVELSTTKAVFTYSYSDLPGDPKQLLAKYFDAFYYIANWGTQQLAFRFPKALIDSNAIEPYCLEDCISLSYMGDYAILDWEFSQEEGFDYWIEGEGILSQLVGLRQEILQQDYRGLYLAWLKAITRSPEYITLEPTQLEPPVPSGLNQLSNVQAAFKEIFQLDEHLLKAASASSSEPTVVSEQTIEQAISQLSRSECDAFLLRLARAEPHLSVKFRQELLGAIATSPSPDGSKRTIQQLLDAAQTERAEAEKHQQQAAEARRIQELQALAGRETQAWDEVETLLQKPQAKTYDRAVQLLVQLRDLAQYRDQYPAFQEQLNQIYGQYSKRNAFVERLRRARLL